ncbi:MAG: DUF2723 domain-containing protein [Chryseolinea sp.]
MIFNKKDYYFFAAASILILIGFICMAIDPVDNGFGVLTLWIAPFVLLAGFFLPVIGIIGLTQALGIRFKLFTLKHIFGFGVFIVALITYLVTLEPTASLWDCSEFIASAYKLQVSHTPGTPLSILIARIFTMTAPNVKQVAWTINAMSALFSASTVYLVYHTIYFFANRMADPRHSNQGILIIASLLGSLTLTFSDTFWFSAVEAETYGAACFFLMLLVTLIIRGIDLSEPLKSRWLILIFYVGGLSYCIHPMCVLALPLLPFAWLVRDTKLTFWNATGTVSFGMIMVFAINRVIGIGSFEAAFGFDRYFVNTLGFPFYSGAIFLVLLLSVIAFYIMKRFPKAKLITLAIIFLSFGFTPYGIIFIRSAHNPPLDENNPEDLAMIKAYMNRESYPSSPLLFGPYFDAQIDEVAVKKNIYHKTNSGYEFSGTMPEYHYQQSRSTILPRMYSNDADHVEAYRQWNGLGENDLPRFSDNLYFMFSYQIWHMYFRYIMFNFSGRESDHQNDNWLHPLDSIRYSGDKKFENKARNQYWMIPLIIGVIGMYFQATKDLKAFIMVVTLFLITGLILALYLNSPPVEPRERDYIYIGSFIAFCIWIGLGANGIYQFFQTKKWCYYLVASLTVAVPLMMLSENLNDHDRSGRTFQIDNARNLLAGCAPDAMLFTGGDNDTFPLWYIQEVEGFRTDVRVVVLSYLNTDWYINQLRNKYYESNPFNLTLSSEDYLQYGPNDVLYIQETLKNGIDLKKFLSVLQQKNSPLRAQSSTGDPYSILPSKVLRLSLADYHLDTSDQNLHKKISYKHSGQPLSDTFEVRVKGNFLAKNGLAILDLIASNGWKRPIYFNYTSLNTAGLDVETHVVQEGNLYRLLPDIHAENFESIPVDKELMYKNLVQNADYSNLKDKHVYFNYEDYLARTINPVRQSFNTLAVAYLKDGDIEMSSKVMMYAIDNLYQEHIEPAYTNLQAADILISLNEKDSAIKITTPLFDFYHDKILADQSVNKTPERLDLYLVKQSAEMLTQLGAVGYQQKVAALLTR